MEKEQTTFSRRLFELRKKNKLSQPELGKRIGTSGAIIGRYERGEMTPSIEVARKLADIFGIILDYLIIERDLPETLNDQDMLNRWQALDELSSADRERILYVVDSLLRDAKAKQANSTTH